MEYRVEITIEDEVIVGTLGIREYLYEIEFEYDGFLFKTEALSQGEGEIFFYFSDLSPVYQLHLELLNEFHYDGRLAQYKDKGCKELNSEKQLTLKVY